MTLQLDPKVGLLIAGRCAPSLSSWPLLRGKGGLLIVNILDPTVTRSVDQAADFLIPHPLIVELVGHAQSCFSERALFVADEVPVVAVLVCGHVYHAKCLDHMTPEANKYDPACPICTVGEKQVLKMSKKVLKAEAELKMRFHKKLKNRVMDSYFDNDLDSFKHGKNTSEQQEKFQKMEPSSSSKMSCGKPFFKRHFSLGSKWIQSTSENDSAKKRGFWGNITKIELFS